MIYLLISTICFALAFVIATLLWKETARRWRADLKAHAQYCDWHNKQIERIAGQLHAYGFELEGGMVIPPTKVEEWPEILGKK